MQPGGAGGKQRTTLRSKKRVRFQSENGEEAGEETTSSENKRTRGAEARERNREYAEAVQEEERANEDGIRRESQNTGGSRASSEAAPVDNDENEAVGGDEEVDQAEEDAW